MKREPLSPDFFRTFLFFDKPIAPVYLRLLCWIYMGLAVIGSIIYGINALRIARFAGGFGVYLFVMISTLLVLFISVTLIRLIFDWAILFFSKNEYLKKIAEQKTAAPPTAIPGTPRQAVKHTLSDGGV